MPSTPHGGRSRRCPLDRNPIEYRCLGLPFVTELRDIDQSWGPRPGVQSTGEAERVRSSQQRVSALSTMMKSPATRPSLGTPPPSETSNVVAA